MKTYYQLCLVGILPLAICASISGLSNPICLFVACLWLMLVWWSTEVVPLAVTALVPIILFPILGIMDMGAVTSNYAKPIVFLFMGGFFIAKSLEVWGLHRRIAFIIVSICPGSPRGILAGFMVATAGLSMWISNTATTIMMVSIGLSVANYLTDSADLDRSVAVRINTTIMLGIAYAASIGGSSTLIGTPPNLFLATFLQEQYGIVLDMATWMRYGIPYLCIMLPLAWGYLSWTMGPVRSQSFDNLKQVIHQQLVSLGSISPEEKRVLIIFMITAIAWIGRRFINDWLGGTIVSDTTIAMVGAMVLFLWPVMPKGGERKKRTSLLTWDQAQTIPWGVLLLFGAGLSIANGVSETGLQALIMGQLSIVDHLPIWTLVAGLTIATLAITEISSNLASIAMLLPLVTAIAMQVGAPLLLICVPVTLAASAAFMLPISTPPNAIVLAYRPLTIRMMVSRGVVLNIVSIISILAVMAIL
ncbi:anion transporter [bacterium]|nr:anion transporter [bacterium]|tara:strand:- start:95 stop:1519 length:1425 start_codon:yes stop_codon:yes gene_type:complete